MSSRAFSLNITKILPEDAAVFSFFNTTQVINNLRRVYRAMRDPYDILGVNRDATDEQIKAAYRGLVKKYHPDQYNSSPLFDLAAEKMKEVNEAYDQIMDERKARANGSNSGSYQSSYSSGYGGYSYGSTNYSDIRNLLLSGRIIEAEQILDGIPVKSRDAEWYFLKGTVQFRKGFLEEAYNNIATACNMDPSNMEYRSALNQMNNQRNGMYGGYNTSMNNRGNCNSCDICSGMICADCCCECMGGDLIRCC